MSFRVIIPARHASMRLPGKPLLEIAGKPMIQHVYERAVASGAQEVVVATDDPRIGEAAERFGARVCITATHHTSGTERLAEAARKLGYADEDIVVNLQGDEPLMPPELLTQVAENLRTHSAADIATLCTRIQTAAELFNSNVVKLVTDQAGYALYFSRAPIPWDRDAFATEPSKLPAGVAHWRHLGIYAYRVGFLQRYVTSPAAELEQRESLEQLRVLWMGKRIFVAQAKVLPGPGVDTPEDLEYVRGLMS